MNKKADKPKEEVDDLPIPPRYLQVDEEITGVYVSHEVQTYDTGKKVVYVYVLGKDGSEVCVRVGVSSGQMYQSLYSILKDKQPGMVLSFSKSDGMKGRQINLVQTDKKK